MTPSEIEKCPGHPLNTPMHLSTLDEIYKIKDPDAEVVEKARSMCRGISEVLKEGGTHLHISFAQPHFRRKYLLGLHGEQKGENGEVIGWERSDGNAQYVNRCN